MIQPISPIIVSTKLSSHDQIKPIEVWKTCTSCILLYLMDIMIFNENNMLIEIVFY